MMQIILDQQMFLDHLVNIRVVIRAVKINQAQILHFRVLSLRKRNRSPNSGNVSDVFELFPTDELLCLRNMVMRKLIVT